MNIRNAGLALGGTLVAVLAVAATSQNSRSFAPNVNLETGQIRVPENYTRWPTLGTWSHAKTEGKPGAKEYHVVYTQPETIDYYRKHGRYPDGAVLVKELINTETMPMTTGEAVSHATTIKGWFVLVRDTQGKPALDRNCGAMVGAGRFSMPVIPSKRFRPIIKWIALHVTCPPGKWRVPMPMNLIN